ncbi:MAG: glycosyltransferase family 87 protein [Thermomicrobiales bacterium]
MSLTHSRIAPSLFLALFAALLALIAYQPTSSHRIDIANEQADLTGFYSREESPQFAFRWTRQESAVRLPPIPSGAYTLTIGVAAPRPAGGAPPVVELMLDGTVIERITVGPDYQRHTVRVRVPVAGTGVHTLQLHSEVFTEPTRNPRTLGVAVTDVGIASARWPLIPPLIPLLAFIGETVLLYRLLLTRWAPRPAFVATLVVALAVTALLFVPHQPFAMVVDAAFLPLTSICALALIRHYRAYRAARPIWAIGATAVVLSSAASATTFLHSLGAGGTTDFGIFYRAATAVWTGNLHDLYDLKGLAADPLLGVIYRQPPFPAVLIAPLSLLSYHSALMVWRILLVGCVAAGIGLLVAELRLYAIGAPRGWPAVILVALTLLWLPLRGSIVGQWDSILLLLLVLTLIGLRRHWSPLTGIAIGLAGLIKVYPLYLGLFLLWKREWRALGWLIASLIAFTGLSTLIVGWETTALFFRHVLPQIGGSTTYAENQSLLALLLRVFGIQEIRGPRVTVLTALSLLLVTLPLCWRLRARPARTSPRYAADFSLTVGTMLLAIPVAWQHYEVVLLIPVGVLLLILGISPAPPLVWRVCAMWAIAFLAFGQDVLLRDLLRLPLGRHSYFDVTVLVSAPIFAQIGLAVSLWRRIEERRDRDWVVTHASDQDTARAVPGLDHGQPIPETSAITSQRPAR